MYKKTTICLLLVCVGLNAQERVWERRNERKDDAGTVTELVSSDARVCRVISTNSLGDSDARVISNSLNAVWAIPGLRGTESSARMDEKSDGGFRLVVYPVSFMNGGEELSGYFPSGMTFYFRTSLFYDISMKVDDLMPKVTGAFVSPEGLIKHISAAILMPEMYMFDQSLLGRIDRLEKALIAALAKSAPKVGVSPETTLAVLNEYNANPNQNSEAVFTALKKKGLKTNIKEVRAVLWTHFGIF
ncbi:MAG: hypothetical protein LBG05_04260 [Treponema sp.]|jgi:hypothetical protein|nr:hypothetical protein [Treponema sp.]